MESLIPPERIESKVLLIRGQKVMLDRDLAELYGVETRTLNQAVTRNMDRFPSDFMFRLSVKESSAVVSQFVIPHLKYFGGHAPRAFTEHGVAMLSSILNSPQAVQVNIQIMRTFAKLRRILASESELAKRLDKLEKKFRSHDTKIRSVFAAIRELMWEPEKPRPRIGFQPPKSDNIQPNGLKAPPPRAAQRRRPHGHHRVRLRPP